MRGNTITMRLIPGSVAMVDGLFQYDYGQKLILSGVELPPAYEVHFSNCEYGSSKTSLGDSTGVEIPDEYLLSGEDVHVWLFLHDSESDGETEYHGVIHVQHRAQPTNTEPTPVQQDVITTTIAILNEAVEDVQSIAEGISDTIDAALQEAKDSGEFDGFSPTASVAKEGRTATITITDQNGTTQASVTDGDPSDLIDDNAGEGTTDRTWSANKLALAIKDLNSFDIEIVQELPTENIKTHTIYFVPKTGELSDMYDEYMYINQTWELIGTTQVDVSNKADKADTILDTTLSRGRKEGSTTGLGSFAFGDDVAAAGAYSHAEGKTTIASGDYSHAEGFGSSGKGAKGRADHTEGYNTYALSGSSTNVAGAHAEGHTTSATGSGAHAEGISSQASAGGAHAEGGYTQAQSVYAHAEGYLSKATNSYSHSEGYNTTASGLYSHAEGFQTRATADQSHAEGYGGSGYGALGKADHAEGYQTTANSGPYNTYYGAHAEGRNTVASNQGAHAEGWGAVASGSASHAEGSSTASGDGAHAEGGVTTASGQNAHSEGNHTVASGYHSHAQGFYTTASGSQSFAAGAQTIANGVDMFAFGRYNVPAVTQYPDWVSGTHYEVGDKVRAKDPMMLPEPMWMDYECKIANSDTRFNNTKWKIAPSPSEYTPLEAVGYGTNDNNRSNVRTLYKQGNEFLKGDLYVHANADGTDGDKVMAEPASEGTSGQVLTTDGQGGRSWTTVEAGTSIIDDTAGSGDTDKVWSADKSSSEINSLNSAINGKISEPSSEGTSGQILTTDGNGGRVWTTPTGSAVTVDNTLSVSGAAADAAATGAVKSKADKAITVDYSKATAISNGADLNSLTTPGNYYANTNTVAGSLSHCPVGISFRMNVFTTTSSTRGYQIIYKNSTGYTEQEIWYRSFNSTLWTDWKKISDDRDKTSLQFDVSKITWTSGASIKTDGTVNTEGVETNKCTDYIPVKAGSRIVIRGVDLRSTRNLCGYDASKTFVSCIITGSSSYNENSTIKIDIPSTVFYIRTQKHQDTTGFSIEYESIEYDFVSHGCDAFITSSNKSDYFDDFNDAPVNSVFAIGTSAEMANSPYGNSTSTASGVYDGTYRSVTGYLQGILITRNVMTNLCKEQVFISFAGTNFERSVLYFRIYYNGTWGIWKCASDLVMTKSSNMAIRKKLIAPYLDGQGNPTATDTGIPNPQCMISEPEIFDDFDDAPANTIYQIDLDCDATVMAHNPFPGKSSALFTTGPIYISRHALCQFCVALKGGSEDDMYTAYMAFRYGYLKTSDTYVWTNWQYVFTEEQPPVLVSQNGTRYRLKVANDGTLSTEVVS